jgi:mycothiol synthase
MTIEQPAVENAPEIPGLSFRPFRGAADFGPMAAVLTESQRADHYERSVSAEDLAKAYANSLTNCDPARDMIMAQVAGELVGYVRGWWEEESPSLLLYRHGGFLLPAWRRKGIGRAMLGWVEKRLKMIAENHPRGPNKSFQISVSQFQEGTVALLEQAGYRPVRYFLEMVRPNLDALPDFPLPVGLEIRPVTPDQYRGIWESAHHSSEEEWGNPEPTEKAYQDWLKDVLFQPQLWQVAWDKETGRSAGHVLSYINHEENKQFDRQRGYTEGVGVSREWRRRGVARALISHSLQAQKAAGMNESALVADSASTSGVTALYESCSFQIVKRDTVYRKPLSSI